MDRYDAWKPLLRQIQHAAGLDPDGPPRPMQARLTPMQTLEALLQEGEIAYRDAMLRRALRFM